MIPIISIPFKFSKDSANWLEMNLQPFIDEFYKSFPETGGFHIKKHHPYSSQFQKSPPIEQITELLKVIGFEKFYSHLIIHKKIERKGTWIENPHFDTSNYRLLPARLNILIKGDDQSSMYWWNKEITDDDIVQKNTPIGLRYEIKDREKIPFFRQNPDFIEKKLSKINQSGDFIRTEILHSICRTGNERIVVSTEIHHSWKEIYEKVKLYKDNLNVL